MQINPIRWANISFCDQQFSYGYKESCIKYLNQLTFCKANPEMASGKAYLIYAELVTSVSGKPYVPYMILIGWTLFALLMALMFTMWKFIQAHFMVIWKILLSQADTNLWSHQS